MDMYKFWKSECERVGDQVDRIFYSSSKNSIQYIKDNSTLTVVFDDKNKSEKLYLRKNDVITGDLGTRLVTLSRNGQGVSCAEPIEYVLMPESLYKIAENYRDDCPERYQTRKDLNIEYDKPQQKKSLFRGFDR